MNLANAAASIAALLACLFLALRALRSHGMSFENRAWMAAAWVLIIAILAFVITRLGH